MFRATSLCLYAQVLDLEKGDVVAETIEMTEDIEALYKTVPNAVDKMTLTITEKLSINLTPTQKYILQYGDSNLTYEERKELNETYIEKFKEQIKNYDTLISNITSEEE